MKPLWLVIIILILVKTSFSQEIILRFNTQGDTTIIDSIVAINQITCDRVKFTGTNTLHLSSLFTPTNFIKNEESKNLIYPNPFRKKVVVQYFSKQKENLRVTLTNQLGQIVVSKEYQVNHGTHKFEIICNSTGLYILNIRGPSGTASFKAICLQNNSGTNQIKYSGISDEKFAEKSAFAEEAQKIHFRIYSNKYTTIITDTPTESKTYNVEFIDCIDDDGKNYAVVQIGEQWWMAENLAYLPKVSPPLEESLTEPYYYVLQYQGSNTNEAKTTENYKIYGALYNWPAAIESCPNGWHLPSYEEWEQLAQYISDQKGPFNKEEKDPYNEDENNWEDVGKYLKAACWAEDDNGLWAYDEVISKETDSFGFSALPGRARSLDAFMGDPGYYAYWWSANEKSYTVWYRALYYYTNKFYNTYYFRDGGLSVRCTKD